MSRFMKKVRDAMSFGTDAKPPSRYEADIPHNLTKDSFQFAKTIRHGLPGMVTVSAYDPVQRLLALGTSSGSVKIYGAPGVECTFNHLAEGDTSAIVGLVFLVNRGRLITATKANRVYLWDFTAGDGRRPVNVSMLAFKEEAISFLHLATASTWLFVGTEKGNIHMVNAETLSLSAFVIYWNHLIPVSVKQPPGRITGIQEHPYDNTKLLVTNEPGNIAIFDLKARKLHKRYGPHTLGHVLCSTWHSDGKQFACGHASGAVSVWGLKHDAKPDAVLNQGSGEADSDERLPITALRFFSMQSDSAMMVFAGGGSVLDNLHTVSIIMGRTEKTLCFDHEILDLQITPVTPWAMDCQQPPLVLAIQAHSIEAIDLQAQGFPQVMVPYSLDLQSSPLACVAFYPDVPADLVTVLRWAGRRQQTQFSKRATNWPVSGGLPNETSNPVLDIVLTGDVNGHVFFWDASTSALSLLYVLDMSQYAHLTEESDGPKPIKNVVFCPLSRLLAVTLNGGDVFVFVFGTSSRTVVVPTIVAQRRAARLVDMRRPSAVLDATRVPGGVPTEGSSSSPPPQAASDDAWQPTPTPETTPAKAAAAAAAAASTPAPPGAAANSAGAAPDQMHRSPSVSSTDSKGLSKLMGKLTLTKKSGKQVASNETGSPLPQGDAAPSTPGAASAPASSASAPASANGASPKIPAQLLSLGFSEAWCHEAMSKTKSLNEAAAWLFENARTLDEEQSAPAADSVSVTARSTSSKSSSASKPHSAAGTSASQSSRADGPQTPGTPGAHTHSEVSSLSSGATGHERSAAGHATFNAEPGFQPHFHFKAANQDRGAQLRNINVVAVSAFWGMVVVGDDLGLSAIDVANRVLVTDISAVDFPTGSSSTGTVGPQAGSAATTAERRLGVTSLQFADLYLNPRDGLLCPTVLVGTQAGSVHILTVSSIPSLSLALATSLHFSTPSKVLSTHVLDRYGQEIVAPAVEYEEPTDQLPASAPLSASTSTEMLNNTPAGDGTVSKGRGNLGLALAPAAVVGSSSSSAPDEAAATSTENHFVVIVSTQQIRAMVMPEQKRLHKFHLPANDSFMASRVASVGAESCLLATTRSGACRVFGLLDLRPLLEVKGPELGVFGLDVCTLSPDCRAMFVTEQNELQRITFTFNDALCHELSGGLFNPSTPMPSRPTASMLKSIFSGTSVVDRDELFGGGGQSFAGEQMETSDQKRIRAERAARNVGNAGLQATTGDSETVKGALANAGMALNERGEKLNRVVERSENMAKSAADFASRVREYNAKEAAKKWYEL
ncbi:hypothetical protein CAOG_01480 [Capsaspora owczarzaki ATCC 30864]|uniref:hypothetical protein n=1 Tax=Capsaspora owczarzaki (strain ATCC 30864) TaxID=595528 RepID=UPI00035246E8|nr:hypothetical protein CAOG_01480 [Capsaspora owczarzaki ATCC 30864]|eukprot:XP_004364348.2 hypothetical protein CAOG_01480 [Capsaspora owczarzaki ATCC 30864]